MIHNITKEEYINNPCGTCSVAYWKNSVFKIPQNTKIIHEQNYFPDANDTVSRYFRLSHDLERIHTSFNSDYTIEKVNIKEHMQIVVNILETCYGANYSAETVETWTKSRVYDSDLWIFIVEKSSRNRIALGIADFDPEIKEGSLEWIQVMPEYRRLGIGQLLVSNLLTILKQKAYFVTVSGECDNTTKPDLLYRKCGFVGNDIWCVVQK